jgi:hypothetical protein
MSLWHAYAVLLAFNCPRGLLLQLTERQVPGSEAVLRERTPIEGHPRLQVPIHPIGMGGSRTPSHAGEAF